VNKSQIKALGLKEYVQCHVCEEFVLLPPDHQGAVPSHDNCSGARYSYIEKKYEVASPEQSLALAKLLVEDDGKCLRGGGHSLACADGQECTDERRRLARALAEFVIEDLEGASV
jgi:hypothetical protein